MTCPEKLTEVEDIQDIPAPTTDITEEALLTPQKPSSEKTAKPAKQERFVVTRTKKVIAKPPKPNVSTFKKKPKARKGRKSVKKADADS